MMWREYADGKEYEVLESAVDAIRGVPGMVVEIGTRRGGSAMLVMDRLLANGDHGRVMLCVDPYGNIPYMGEEGNVVRLDYTNDMRAAAARDLHFYAHGKPVNLLLLALEDTEFFKRFGDGYPVYDDEKRIMNEYALVYFDGPHTLSAVRRECEFFAVRSSPGSVFVFDDIDHYDHDSLERELFLAGYECLQRLSRKASYRKRVAA